MARYRFVFIFVFLSCINVMPHSVEEEKERCPHILKPEKGMGYAAVCSGKKPGAFASDVVTILLHVDIVL